MVQPDTPSRYRDGGMCPPQMSPKTNALCSFPVLQAELEIGEVFEEWQQTAGAGPQRAPVLPTPVTAPPPPEPPPRGSSRGWLLPAGAGTRAGCEDIDDVKDVPDVVLRPSNGDSTPPRRLSNNKRRSRRGRASRRYNTDTVVTGDWSDDVLADFHDLIVQELAALALEQASDDEELDAVDMVRFRVGSRSMSAPVSGAGSPSASPTPPPEEPRLRPRWLRRRAVDDDAVLVSITPLPEDDDYLGSLSVPSSRTALPDLLPARRAATLPAGPAAVVAAAAAAGQPLRRRPGSGGELLPVREEVAVKRRASLKRAAVKSAGPDLITEDDVPTQNGGVSNSNAFSICT